MQTEGEKDWKREEREQAVRDSIESSLPLRQFLHGSMDPNLLLLTTEQIIGYQRCYCNELGITPGGKRLRRWVMTDGSWHPFW
jgi:hypothetical protein